MLDNTVERAFELAASGRFRSVEEIRRELLREQASNVRAHLSGLLIRRQLQNRMNVHRRRRPRRMEDPS